MEQTDPGHASCGSRIPLPHVPHTLAVSRRRISPEIGRRSRRLAQAVRTLQRFEVRGRSCRPVPPVSRRPADVGICRYFVPPVAVQSRRVPRRSLASRLQRPTSPRTRGVVPVLEAAPAEGTHTIRARAVEGWRPSAAGHSHNHRSWKSSLEVMPNTCECEGGPWAAPFGMQWLGARGCCGVRVRVIDIAFFGLEGRHPCWSASFPAPGAAARPWIRYR